VENSSCVVAKCRAIHLVRFSWAYKNGRRAGVAIYRTHQPIPHASDYQLGSSQAEELPSNISQEGWTPSSRPATKLITWEDSVTPEESKKMDQALTEFLE
jgi:hypothetical protein